METGKRFDRDWAEDILGHYCTIRNIFEKQNCIVHEGNKCHSGLLEFEIQGRKWSGIGNRVRS